MKLVVGLGNVGQRYETTRHNTGFMVVDRLAKQLEASWKENAKFSAFIAEADFNGERVLLVKPTTMMNLSGRAVSAVLAFYKLGVEMVWVVYDEIDLPLGDIVVRLGGSSGGHQGVQSLIDSVGEGFTRVRVGIDPNDRTRQPSESYVLEAFSPAQQGKLPEVIEAAAELTLDSLMSKEAVRKKVF